MRLLMALLMAVVLAGCGTMANVESPLDDGYQPGDVSMTVLEWQATYCANADYRRRALLLGALHTAGAPIPPRGACTDILTLVDPADLPEVDLEAAQEDQKRFEELRDAGTDTQASGDNEST